MLLLHRGCALWIIAAALAPSGALAQSATETAPAEASNDTALEEIVVTARRREENLQDAPVAVTALTAEALQAASASTVRDVALITPNVSSTSGPTANRSDANFFVRGIGQEDSNATRDPGVGVYLDGVYIGRTTGAALENLDIERIEVLRGPQGTLFGRNTIGGAVNVVTERPDGELAGRAQVTIGERQRIDAKATVRFPITDVLAGSLSLMSRNQDGWVKRVFDDRTLGDINLLAGRAKLAADFSDSVRALLAFDYTRSRGTVGPTLLGGVSTTKVVPNLVFVNGPNNPPVLQNPPTLTVPRTTPFGVPLPEGMNSQICVTRWCDRSFQSTRIDNPSDVWGTSLNLEWDMGGADFKSITSYRHLDLISSPDFDATSYVVYDQVAPTKQSQFSQELQLSGASFNNRMNWIAGLYYFQEKVDQNITIAFGSNQNLLNPIPAADVRLVSTNQFIQPDTESYAGFAQATVSLTDQLSLTAGGRLTHDKKSIKYNIFIDNTLNGLQLSLNNGSRPDLSPPFRFFVPAGGILPSNIPDRQASWTPFTWRAGLEYKPTDDIMAYGVVSTGFRSGGFNGRPTNPAEATAFRPERTRTYELGLKTELFDRSTRFNVAAFYTDYSNIQVLVQRGVFLSFDNTEATNKGFEAELVTQPINNLRINASVGYLDSRIEKTVSERIREGDRLAQSPKWTVHVGPQYTFDFEDSGELTLRADYFYKGKVKFYNSSVPVLGEQDGFGLWNARVTWEPESGKLQVAAYGLNIFDKKYIYQASADLTSFGTYTVEPAPLSEFGVEATIRF